MNCWEQSVIGLSVELSVELSKLPEELRAQGRKPYAIGIGGSNGVGATGYVLAMMELAEQLRATQQRVDHIVFASSSGGTQAGVVLGAQVAPLGADCMECPSTKMV